MGKIHGLIVTDAEGGLLKDSYGYVLLFKTKEDAAAQTPTGGRQHVVVTAWVKRRRPPAGLKPARPPCPRCGNGLRVKPGTGPTTPVPLWQCRHCLESLPPPECEWTPAMVNVLDGLRDA